jgi:hypothetical protein
MRTRNEKKSKKQTKTNSSNYSKKSGGSELSPAEAAAAQPNQIRIGSRTNLNCMPDGVIGLIDGAGGPKNALKQCTRSYKKTLSDPNYLKYIKMNRFESIDDPNIMVRKRFNIRKQFINLKKVEFRDHSNLTDATVIAIANKCPNLTSLNLSGCKEITDNAIIHIARKCKLLSTLNLHSCLQITDTSILEIAKKCPSLSTLSLDNFIGYAFTNESKITDTSIMAIAGNCPSLTSLNLRSCTNITDNSINAIAGNCPSLTSLNVSRVSKITEVSILAIATNCPLLTSLILTDCYQFNNTSVANDIAHHCKSLTALGLYHSCEEEHDVDAENAILKITKNYDKLTKLENGNEMSANSLNSIANNCTSLTSIELHIRNLDNPAIAADDADDAADDATATVADDGTEGSDFAEVTVGSTELPSDDDISLVTLSDVTVSDVASDYDSLAEDASEVSDNDMAEDALDDGTVSYDKALDNIAVECKKLKEIRFWGQYHFGISTLNSDLFSKFSLENITNLAIYGLKLTNGMIDTISEKCTSLTTLKMSNVELGDDPNESIGKIVRETLTSLTIGGIGEEDDEDTMDTGISAISENCRSLTSLSIGEMVLDGTMLTGIANNCKLTTLSLQSLWDIPQSQLVKFINECPTLSNLNITDTDEQDKVIAEIVTRNKKYGTTKIVYTTEQNPGRYCEYD